MADKITSPEVIEAKQLVEDIGKVETAFANLLAQMKLVTSESGNFKTQGQGNQTLQQRVVIEEKAAALIKERARLENALTREQAKRTQIDRTTNQNLQQQRVATQALNRNQREAAILTSKYVGAYQKLNLQRSQASKTLRDLIASEKASNDELVKAQANFDKLDSKVKKADAAVRDSTKNVGNYKSAFQGFTGIVRGLVGAFGIVEGLRLGIGFAKDAADLARQAKGVEFAFRDLGDTGEDAFKRIKDSSRGLLSDLDIKRSLVELNNFNIGLEDTNTLFEFLLVRSAQTGRSIDSLRDSLVEGLSKESLLRIDNLGISTADLNDELSKTPNFVQAVANIAKKEVAEAGNILDDAANSTEAWNASWENLKLSIGQAFTQIKGSGPVIDILDTLNETQQALNVNWEQGGGFLKNLTINFRQFTESGREANKQMVIDNELRRENVRAVNAQISAYVALNGSLAPLNKPTNEENTPFPFRVKDEDVRRLADINAELEKANGILDEGNFSTRNEAKAIQDKIEALEKERDAILGVDKARKDAEKIINGTIAYYENLIKKEKEYQNTEATTADAIQESNFKVLEYQASIDKLINSRERLNKLEFGTIGSTSDLSREFDKITSPLQNLGFSPLELDASDALSELERFNNARIRGEEAYTELLNNQKDERAEIIRGLFGEFERIYGIDASAFSSLIDSKKNDFESFANVAGELNNLIFNIGEQNRQAELENSKNALDQVLKDEKKSDEQKLAAQIKFDKEEARIKRKNFEAQKIASLTQIAIDTATAIVKATAQTGVLAPAFIPSIIALGAIQAAIVAAQKTPQFFKGTENAPKGWAWTDEKGAEIHTDKAGNIKDYGSDSGARLKFLNEGDKIFTADKTKKIKKALFQGHEERLKYKSTTEDSRLYNEVAQLRKEMRRYANRTPVIDNRVVIEQPVTRY